MMAPRAMPKIGISLGDPAGIGPEVVAAALAARPDLDLLVFGDREILARAAAAAGVPSPPASRVMPVTESSPGAIAAGRPDDASGTAQVAYLTAATDAALRGDIAAQ